MPYLERSEVWDPHGDLKGPNDGRESCVIKALVCLQQSELKRLLEILSKQQGLKPHTGHSADDVNYPQYVPIKGKSLMRAKQGNQVGRQIWTCGMRSFGPAWDRGDR